jgi:murein DD-endopeptidase MepM/ murein hydrolase activator NlpD
MPEEKKRRKYWISKLKNKYKLVILNDETYEERFSFRLSRMNVFVAGGTGAILLIILTTILIAFTPLREYIPGYTDVGLYEDFYRMKEVTDSLDMAVRQKSQYLENLRMILEGRDTSYTGSTAQSTSGYGQITMTRSREDSLLRADWESQNYYTTYPVTGDPRQEFRTQITDFTFYTPLRGIVTNHFDPSRKHYGIDIVSVQNEAIKATLNGVVVFTGWTLETGYVIGIQHAFNLFSVYKHNSALLKEQGSYVKAGDGIAIVGSSGELSTGPHLHFEIWYNGVPVNPAEVIVF